MTIALTPTAPLVGAAAVRARIDQAVSGLFLTAAAENPHDPGRLSMSGIGACARLAAYQIAGYAPTDLRPIEKRAADLGTAIHEWMLPRLGAALGGTWTRIEHPVTLTTPEGQITGTLDLATEHLGGAATLALSPDAFDDGATVLDLKTLSRHRFDLVDASGEPFDEHVYQVDGYGVALTQQGTVVRWTAWLYICRETGRTRTIVRELDPDAIRALLDRITTLHAYAENPEFAPRERRGPGLSVECDGCPFLTRCWGIGAEPGVTGAQRTIAVTDEEVTSAAVNYNDARANRLEWDKWEKFWALVLADREGTYTDGERTVSLGSRPGANMPDQKAMARLLADRGVPIPRSRNRPSLVVKISHTPTTGLPKEDS